MPSFEVYGKVALKEGDLEDDPVGGRIALNVAKNCLKNSLEKHYGKGAITLTPDGLALDGDLQGSWERAITKAEVKLKVEGGQLTYRVDGKSSLGFWPWVWFILGLFTGFFFVWFGIDLVKYLLSRDRPKRYFEEAFKSVEFELGP